MSRIFRLLSPRRRREPRSPARNSRRLEVEALEDRRLPSGGYLLVGSLDNNSILRYSETTGAFVDQFDPHNLANLKNPNAAVFGSDGNLYVSSGVFQHNNHEVLQYNGTTGAFQAVFASQNMTGPRGLLFGPDGNLYVADASGKTGVPATVERFDGKTGAFLNTFNQESSYGLTTSPSYMVFGPDGDLYVAAVHEGVIYRYDGTTGAPLPAPGQPGAIFVPAGSGGLDGPAGIVFGADGNLYVASANWFTTSNNGPFYDGDFPPGAVLRFEGPSGPNPGAFLGTFVAGGSGGLANPNGILFGPDGDLFVASSVEHGSEGNPLNAEPGTSQVLRYDGTTGAFLGTFVTPDSGGLKNAWFLTFTETNPTTLNYDTPNGPVSVSAAPATQTALVTNLAPLASSLLDRRQPALLAAPLPGTVSPSAAPTSQSGFLLTPGASSPAPAGSTDVVFVPFQIAGNDDDAWLFKPLLSGGPDGLISSSSSIKF
jgi:sugar lactone lactonase YvrE